MFSFDLDSLVADVKEFDKRVHHVDELVNRSSPELKAHFEVSRGVLSTATAVELNAQVAMDRVHAVFGTLIADQEACLELNQQVSSTLSLPAVPRYSNACLE